MKARLAAVAVAVAVACAAASGDARAQPAPSAKTVVTLDGTPMFGKDAVVGDGWNEIVARVENVSGAPVKGTVELATSGVTSYRTGSSDQGFTARGAFALPAGGSAVLRLPMHALTSYVPQVTLRAIRDDGAKLAETTVTPTGGLAPVLVEVDPTPRLAGQMRGWPITPAWNPLIYAYYGGSATGALSTGAPAFDRTTGDPILPDEAAAYAAVSAVVIHSDLLARLDATSLDALVNYVLAGGTLAIVVNRPEDLRLGTIPALAGGTVTPAAVPAVLDTLPAVERPPNPGYFQPPDDMERFVPAPSPEGAYVPIQYVPARGTPAKPPTTPSTGPRLGPLPAVKEKLQGFAGGNLLPSHFGASAAYGLGEIHLLAFDPTVEPGISDGWVHGRVLELVDRAFTRHARIAFPQGAGDRRMPGSEEMRRALDPNENFRVALGIAAILLVLYSIAAGPLTFIRAARRGRPLDPLLWVPAWSAATLGLIVFVGLAGKGWRGRARRVSLVEIGAGMSRGPIRRFRGFFSSATRALTIQSSDGTCVLDVASSDASDHGQTVLRVDRGSAALENVTALPWQTVVVAEDGMVELPGGVTILTLSNGTDVEVTNRTGRTLKDVLVWAPKQGVAYFPSLANGDKVSTTGAKIVAPTGTLSHIVAGTVDVHPLDAGRLASATKTGVEKEWAALGASSGGGADWWPDDVPVVLAEIDGGERAGSDSGLSVEVDRLFLRVVGQGGAP